MNHFSMPCSWGKLTSVVRLMQLDGLEQMGFHAIGAIRGIDEHAEMAATI